MFYIINAVFISTTVFGIILVTYCTVMFNKVWGFDFSHHFCTVLVCQQRLVYGLLHIFCGY